MGPVHALLLLALGAVGTASLQPIFLVPGVGGSSLWAETKDAEVPECAEWSRKPNGKYTREKHRIWLSFYELLWPTCWSAVLEMDFNKSSSQFESKKGVFVEPDNFGGLSGLSHIGHLTKNTPVVAEFAKLIENLQEKGYEEGKTLFGIPYDFRLAPQQIDWERVKKLAEDAVQKNGGKRLVWVAHSMGNLMSTYIFNNVVSKAWKDKHIEVFLSAAAPYGGALYALPAVISGDMEMFKVKGVQMVKRSAVRRVNRNAGTAFGVRGGLPSRSSRDLKTGATEEEEEKFEDEMNEMIQRFAGESDFNSIAGVPGAPLKPPSLMGRNLTGTYTAQNWTLLLPQPERSNIEATLSQVPDLKLDEDPGIPSICVWGTGLKVPSAVGWAEKSLNAEPEVLSSTDGDGTVAVQSASACSNWKSNRLSVSVKSEHLELLFSSDLQKAVGLLGEKGVDQAVKEMKKKGNLKEGDVLIELSRQKLRGPLSGLTQVTVPLRLNRPSNDMISSNATISSGSRTENIGEAFEVYLEATKASRSEDEETLRREFERLAAEKGVQAEGVKREEKEVVVVV